MKLGVPDPLASQLKQLTWLAGRKSTPNHKLRYVWLDRLGAAATDGYAAGWFPSQEFAGYLTHDQALRALAGPLRTQLGGRDAKLDLERVPSGLGLTEWLTLTAGKAIIQGVRFNVNPRQLQDLLASEQKHHHRTRVQLAEDVHLHIPTTKRALRQTKSTSALAFHWWNGIMYWHDPKTKLELMVTGIHPKLDPERTET